MLFCIADASHPVKYISCGNLLSTDGFLHDRRRMDCFVFIIVTQGTLHLHQEGHNLDIGENQSVLLFPGKLHYGSRPSKGKLSYYWVHFSGDTSHFHICNQNSLEKWWNVGEEQPLSLTPSPMNYFILPESGSLSPEKRSLLLFVQLLDIAKRDNYQDSWHVRYALNLLLSEYTQEILSQGTLLSPQVPAQIHSIIQWIRSHYDEPITVDSLAAQYGYHPTYLTALMKKHTGYPVSSYINHIRIFAAKNLLLSGNTLSVREISQMCGISDEKYFMRLFKKIEGITPSQYRNAFHEKNVNKN
ncbi:MAG TPA: AraC family transcriptional regulator [Candidatus Blautia pullicola]|uniref:AraC family transcriptional regulator n=1 Tax=Candidatus Blautia pullicola TaxID=2838498 RepID=A0A9D2JU26_9FIRM|nr:AraC family transcriptional regulator [Candidatus Blautia pullicola]